MSSEREAAESRLLTGSTPSSNKTNSTASMGDVLTKEQHKDDNEALLPPPPSPAAGDAADQAQSEPPPLLPILDEAATPGQRIETQSSPWLDEREEEDKKSEAKEDQLSEEVAMNCDDAIKNGETNMNLEKMEQHQGVRSAVDYGDGDLCNCEDCKWKKKDLSAEDLQEMIKLRRLGMDLRQYIRYTFNWFMESSGFSGNSIKNAHTLPYAVRLRLPRNPPPLDSEALENFTELRDSVVLLCERVPYHLFMWLVGQAQEFVIGVKVQLLTLLYDRSIENLAEVFLTKLLDGYEALLATAEHISDLLEPLQKELFSKVNLTWSYINKSLYQNYVYSDPLIQNNLPPFIGQLRKHLLLKGSEYHYLVYRYLTFDEEITKIGTLCPEIERLIDKYNAEQVTGSVTGSVMKKLREDFDQKLKLGQPMSNIDLSSKVVSAKEVDDSNSNSTQTEEVPDQNSEPDSRFHVCSIPNAVEIQSMFNDWKKSPQQRLADLVEALTLSSPVEEVEKTVETNTIIEKQCYSSCLDKAVKEGIDKSISWERLACKCHPNSFTADLALNAMEEKSQESQNNEEIHICTFKLENPKETPASENVQPDEIHSVEQLATKHNVESCKEPMKKVLKTVQTAQTQIRHSTTQTSNAAHSHHQNQMHRHHHSGRCSSHSHLHGSLSNAVTKSSGPHRTRTGHNNHQSAAVTCHKPQHVVEHIKRLSASDLSSGENGDCSDSGSSHEDCSATNSPTPRDSSRHCDCCYCEVFGHGVPSVAPVSRNYNEMRERLRQILSKKKAKVCKAVCNSHAKNSVEISLSSSSLSSSSSTSSTITNVDTTLPNPATKSDTPVIKTLKSSPFLDSKFANKLRRYIPTTAVLTIPLRKPSLDDLWNIEAAVEFIEGNQSGKKDSKKAEKKARQKQKKLEEKQKKEKVEEDKQKLIELQKKTPEVTITVVNPQKKNCSQKASLQQKLPEVSILPTSAPPSTFTVIKSTNATSKKKNAEIATNSGKNVTNKAKHTLSLPTSDNAKKKTANVEHDNSLNTVKSKASGKVVEPDSTKIDVSDSPPFLSNLTKKEKKKLRREMAKQEALKKDLEGKEQTGTTPTSSDNQLQIVTIKRIMESNNAEPTVTITLKGQTPAEDRVLFTLVNGQTKDSDGEKQPSTTGKKKKNKGNNTNNQQQGQHAHNKSQQSNNNSFSSMKSEQSQKQESKNAKQQQQQLSVKDKSKNGKHQEEQKLRQLNTGIDTKSTKSKKDKKNSDNKENIKQVASESLPKQGTSTTNKKTNNKGNKVTTCEFIQSSTQKQQQQSNSSTKNTKTNKNQNQNTSQSPNQKKSNNSSQSNSGKAGKPTQHPNAVNLSSVVNKIDNQKVSKVAQNVHVKYKQGTENVQNKKKEQLDSSFNTNQRESMQNVPCSINIENLKLPPGITITKVNAPAKPLLLKSPTAPKPANNTPKQTTIIAAPLSGVQSSNYGPPQGTGNVIVVDTGRLKQDLIPKNMDKDASKDSNSQPSSSKKKKKKKNKNGTGGNNSEKSISHQSSQGTRQQLSHQQQHSSDYMNIEPARILHNPSTNMVTIRNPAFGPPPPKMEPSTQQAAIIRVAENGMVTIRSPALQQAINAGLQPPPKPEFIVKGTPAPSERPSHNNFITSSNDLTTTARGSNGMPLSADIIELRRRLAQPSLHEQASGSSTLFNNGLSSIQISKVTNNGQSPNIPENGINLKGTSVTLTKIRNANQQQHSPSQHQQFEEPKVNGNANAKSRNKKKKRGNGVRSGGDDLTFLESVFTPKDIDLEDGEMDDAERELEAFKRFCLQSVPPPRKEKVNLNIKDIVLKKKSSSSTSSTSTTTSAAATAAAVVAAI